MRRIAVAWLCCAASSAHADPPTSPIVDSNYSIELYDGVALGNTKVIGMGGATVALAIGTVGTLYNPSAPAVRDTTDKDWWTWDYHFDYLNGSLSTDYDNNGFPVDDPTMPTPETGGMSVITGGFGLRFGDWAGAVTGTYQTAPVVNATVALPDGSTSPVVAQNIRFQLAIARWVRELDLALGVAVQAAHFDFTPTCSGDGCDSLFGITAVGLEAGATLAPRRRSYRLGAALTTPVAGGAVTGCDPTNCAGWILPERIVTPWRASIGAAYRLADTEWNQIVDSHFRDEKALTVAADLAVIGPSKNAFGLEAFGMHELQRAGRHHAISFRAGLEYEWWPGRLRLRFGGYWEPGRFVDVGGRMHVTGGIELRVFEFWFWDRLRRGRISLTSDLASRYGNGGLSIGFWH